VDDAYPKVTVPLMAGVLILMMMEAVGVRPPMPAHVSPFLLLALVPLVGLTAMLVSSLTKGELTDALYVAVLLAIVLTALLC